MNVTWNWLLTQARAIIVNPAAPMDIGMIALALHIVYGELWMEWISLLLPLVA